MDFYSLIIAFLKEDIKLKVIMMKIRKVGFELFDIKYFQVFYMMFLDTERYKLIFVGQFVKNIVN